MVRKARLQPEIPSGQIDVRGTILGAIEKVMRESGKTMTVRQIFDSIVSQGLYSFKAINPEHVVRSQIRRHCQGLDFPSASDTKYFRLAGKNRYSLLPEPIVEKSELPTADARSAPKPSTSGS